jgi:hypothetical protein
MEGTKYQVCCKCNENKLLDEYYNDKSKKNGKSSTCKVCRKTKIQEVKKNNINNKIDIEGKHKICTECKVDKPLSDYYRENRANSGVKSKCKVCIEKYKKLYKEVNLEKIKEKQREYSRKETVKKRVKEYRIKHKHRLNLVSKAYREKNKELLKSKKKEYNKNNIENIRVRVRIRLSTNIQAKLAHNLRARFHDALKRQKLTKNSSVLQLTGCNISEVKKHITSLFQNGMNWKNYGEWEIDHIIPIASFDLRDCEQQKKCFNFTNLQPLWKEDNRKKGSKILT